MAGSTEILSRTLGERVVFGEIDDLKDRHSVALGRLDQNDLREYQDKFDMSWIYHDYALEGQVLTPQEIWT
ncbi:MAG: hypothetical protein JRG91_01520, partial [Deltaproteobacteria bacterium]|nr:hypothetical protein [Deltaproteobacteria bacterium]